MKNGCFTAKIDLAFSEKLKQDLISQGFDLAYPPHTVFAAKKPGISCALYESGSLVVQGKEKDPFIEFYLEPEILREFHFSHPEAHLDLSPHIGMDEAGKGDFFGPLCIAALFADADGIRRLSALGVCDSKRLGDGTVKKLAQTLRAEYPFSLIRLFPQKYNELYEKFKNLNRLMAWAHTAALAELVQKTGCTEAILDKFADDFLMQKALEQKKLSVHLQQRTKGEEDLVVAAASILARGAFLEGMESLSQEIGITLPKGASAQVVAAGKQLVAKHGRDILTKAAKTHFKTMSDVTESND